VVPPSTPIEERDTVFVHRFWRKRKFLVLRTPSQVLHAIRSPPSRAFSPGVYPFGDSGRGVSWVGLATIRSVTKQLFGK
jgi:hypothetical protein